jgi:hypothetical protein
MILGLAAPAGAKATKPEKIHVAFGAWTGPGSGSYKSGIRTAIAKDCVFTPKKSARALIEGAVAADGKGSVLSLSVKAAQSGEVVESREFKSPKPSPSRALLNKIGRAVVEMANRAPTDSSPQP